MTTFKSYCSKCLQDTNHIELFRKETNDSFYKNLWKEIFLVVECAGCNNVSFRKEHFDYMNIDPETEEFYTEVSIYPMFLKSRNALGNTNMLPDAIRIAYLESINALKSDCSLLAAAGFRAIIEAVCNDKEITGRNIEKKINNLHANGLLAKTEATRLHSVRFLGNDSIHEIEVPNREKLNGALNIIEHLLSNLYIIDRMILDLDTMIEQYDDFETLLVRMIYQLKKGTKWQLRKVLGKHVRRIIPENLEIFEKKLQENINNGLYKDLCLDTITQETIKGQSIDIGNYIILTANPKLGINRFFQLKLKRTVRRLRSRQRK